MSELLLATCDASDSESRYPPPLLVPPSFPPSLPSTPPPGSSSLPSTMGKEKEKSRIDIILDAPYVNLRGTAGTTVEPAVLNGHVSLYLIEDTDIREVSLHLRGKAKIPVPAAESLINNSSMQTYTFCRHDWAFLETTCNSSTQGTGSSSSKRPLSHTRTLKAGRHIFPFTFTLTGDFPSTLTTHPLNLVSAFPTSVRASIAYKLRAVASRPGLSLGQGPFHNVHIMPTHNLSCTTPVYVLRSLSPVALEYQQSLDMENTWPEKLMYAIMLPHRAWAAGDTLIAVLKLSPLAKGVWVENVVTALWEMTELHVQQHHHKNAPPNGDKSKVVHMERIVRCVKHEIVNGKAVRVDLVGSGKNSGRGSNTPTDSTSRGGSRPGSAMDHSSSSMSSSSRANVDTFIPDEESQFIENHDIVTHITFPIPHLATGPYSSAPAAASPPSSPESRLPSPTSYSYSPHPLPPSSGSSNTRPSLGPSWTPTINPTHNLPPIVVSHRIRWSVSIHNRDGHISELRCSLPIHILDGRILSEAREASVLTRRMTLVANGLWRGEEDEEELGLGSRRGGEPNESGSGGGDTYVDQELPSYTAHVRDRVANMDYSEMATVRVPWVNIVGSGEGTTTDNLAGDGSNAEGGSSRSRRHSQSYQVQRRSTSASGRNTPGHLPAHQPHEHHHHLPHGPSSPSSPSPLDWVNSELMSLSSIRQRGTAQNTTPAFDSVTHSRSESPERSPISGSGVSPLSDGHGPGTAGGGRPIRSLSNLLKATMKPFTALSQSGPSSRRTSPSRRVSIRRSFSATSSPSVSRLHPSHSLLGTSTPHRSLSQVPDYSVASLGFMGGVPPLSSLMGLPSYEEAAGERHRRDSSSPHGHCDDNQASSSSLNVDGVMANSTADTPRGTVSDTNLLGRFGGPSRMGIHQRLESRDNAGGHLSGSDDEEDDGIQMRTRLR